MKFCKLLTALAYADMAAYKSPRGIECAGGLPKPATGKVMRRTLRELEGT